MIIILEGPDGSGKTTLAKRLAHMTGFKLIHRTKPASEEEKRLMMSQYLQAIEEGDNVIFDRCWYSEMVYGPIMRDMSYIDYSQMYALEHKLTVKGAVIIYCTGTPETLWQRCCKRGEDYVVDYAQHIEICSAYDRLMCKRHLVPVMYYEANEDL